MELLAAELRAKLETLTLVGQNEEGELEWAGTAQQWDKARKLEKEYEDRD